MIEQMASEVVNAAPIIATAVEAVVGCLVPLAGGVLLYRGLKGSSVEQQTVSKTDRTTPEKRKTNQGESHESSTQTTPDYARQAQLTAATRGLNKLLASNKQRRVDASGLENVTGTGLRGIGSGRAARLISQRTLTDEEIRGGETVLASGNKELEEISDNQGRWDGWTSSSLGPDGMG